MQVTQELINRFFANKCTALEVEAIALYFSEHTEELNKYLDKEEWDTINAQEGLDPVTSDKIYNAVKSNLFGKPKLRMIAIASKQKYWMAAASLILVAGLALITQPRLFRNGDFANNSILNNQDRNAKQLKIKSPEWRIETNTTSSQKAIELPDGSTVKLYKNSSISFPGSFPYNKREVKLKGDAFFEVAKNKEKPFTVYSGCLSTTALGTSFRVTLDTDNTKNIQVKLYTGKVVIRAIEKLNNWGKDIFLNPGEQMLYTRDAGTMAVVTNFKAVNSRLPGLKSINLQPQSQEIKFDNTSLPEVMKGLSIFFDVKIDFVTASIDKMNFTGTINRTDDITAVLKVIASMNGLESIKTAEGFAIVNPIK